MSPATDQYQRNSLGEFGDSELGEASAPSRRVTLNNALALDSAPDTSTDAEIAIESLLTLSGSRSAPKTPSLEAIPDMMFVPQGPTTMADPGNGIGAQDPASRAPVPKLARLLKDGHGKFIFVGDSSNLAFVQNIRRLVKTELGETGLTRDPLRHAMVEVNASIPLPKGRKVKRPSASEARNLVRHYLLASSGFIDLFEQGEILESISRWAALPEKEEDGVEASIYYLVLAIGTQVKLGAEGREVNDQGVSPGLDGSPSQAEMFLQRGRELVAASFMDDPSVMTIQSYALITFFMLTACRRNGAFMLLGIAVRAAYALGLHRSDISLLFEKKERETRERVWKSLRMLDLYMSASLGRPPATSEVDGGSVSWDAKSRDYETIQMAGLNSSAMLRICFIFERIMNEVYCRREVSVQLVESISRQYRDWTLQLPAGLHTDGLDQTPGSGSPTLQQTIGVAHLKSAYYWSIILLTRPFLIFKVGGKLKRRRKQQQLLQTHQGALGLNSGSSEAADEKGNVGGSASEVTSTLSEACIDAALRSIEIASDLVHTPGVPKRLFVVTNSSFGKCFSWAPLRYHGILCLFCIRLTTPAVSAMVIGFSIFGDFDRNFPLLSSLDQAITILSVMANDDPSARRYEQITGHLRDAAMEHIRRREQRELHRRRKDIHNIFGDPIKETTEASKTFEQSQAHDTMMTQDFSDTGFGIFNDAIQQQEPWSIRFDMPAEGRGPVLTTSGNLADESEQQQQFAFPTYPFDPGLDQFSPAGSGVPSLPSYAEEFPLFSLMTDYDQLQDPYQMGVT